MMITTEELSTLDTLAKRLYAARVFPRTVESVDMAFAILLAGHELGFSPMAAARGITLVNGKVALGADATVATCVRHREVCRYFRLVESTDAVARYETHREGAPAPVSLAYTIEQARRAGLTGSQTWRGHTEAMLRARCAAALARSTYPDLVGGCYDPDEAAEIRGEHHREQPRVVERDPPRDHRELSDLGIEQRNDAIREATAHVGGDNPTLGEHNVAVAQAASDAQLPPAVEAFARLVAEVELPGECVMLWVNRRADLAALPAADREVAWRALCDRCAEVGKMTAKAARVWLKKAIAEEDARRTEAQTIATTGVQS